MIEKLVALEERLTRVEAALLIGVVVFMLFLAVYNVFYRNVLIPLQVNVVESATVEVEVPIEPEPQGEESVDGDPDDFGGGFGGGFEDDSADEGEAGGFGGGFEEDAEPEPESEPEPEPRETDEAAGFGGGFEDESADSDDGDEGGFGGGFGGGFDDPVDEDGVSQKGAAEEPTFRIERRGPEEGSFAYIVAAGVDAVKLEWIDLVLRQLVLVVGFLGSMLATRRRKHITIDALSKILPQSILPWIQVATNLLSVVICALLAVAGWDLVQIGLEFPKEVTEWAEEWMFQLTFPVGFGLLALHFGVRLVESVAWGVTGEPVGTIELEERPTAASATAGGTHGLATRSGDAAEPEVPVAASDEEGAGEEVEVDGPDSSADEGANQ